MLSYGYKLGRISRKKNNYKFYISQGDTNTKGVVIIVNKNIENVNCHIIPQFLNGRLNHISIKLDKCVLHVLNIYGPAQHDERVNFYNHLNEYCRSIVLSYHTIR
jgi:exonuclease III